MRNYFKTIAGLLSEANTKQETFHFDDDDPQAARLALARAREALGPRGVVSVWRRAPTVPGYIPEVGEMLGPDAVGAVVTPRAA